MKKFFVLFLLIIFAVPCFAAGVGYINYEKVAANYTYAKNSIKEIENKGREFEQFLKIKEEEFSKLETPLQKQLKIIID